MLKRNSLFILVLVFAVSLTGCFGFLSGNKVEKLELNAAKVEIGLADEDKTIELTVVGKDKKDKDVVVKLDDVKWTAVGGEVKVTGGKAIFTVTATEAGNATVKATFDKVDSNVVTIKLNEGETPVDYTDLDAAITAAEALKANTGTGTDVEEASEEAHTAFATAIAAAKAVKANAESKQPAVDAAVTALNEAKVAFEAAIVTVDPKLALFEDFDTTTENFKTAAYKSIPGDDDAPLYVLKDSKVTLDDGKVTLVGSRFTIGMTGTTWDSTADGEPSTIGTLDLSKPYKVTIVVSSFIVGEKNNKPDGNLIVYVDNNTTKSAYSEYSESRIVNLTATDDEDKYDDSLKKVMNEDNGVIVVEPTIGKEGSFIQVRSDSGATVVIESIKIEYL